MEHLSRADKGFCVCHLIYPDERIKRQTMLRIHFFFCTRQLGPERWNHLPKVVQTSSGQASIWTKFSCQNMLFEFLTHFLPEPWHFLKSHSCVDTHGLSPWHICNQWSVSVHTVPFSFGLAPAQSTCDKPCLCGSTHWPTKCRHLPHKRS